MDDNASNHLSVLFLNDTGYVNGGAAHVAIMEANALAERGHEVTFFCCDAGPDNSKRQLHSNIRLVSTGQKEILQTPKAQAAIQGIYNRQAVKRLSTLLKEYDPAYTIVHLHAWNKALSPAITRPVRQQGFPLICTLHDYSAACPNGAFYNYPKNAICTLQPMSAKCIATNCDSRNYAQKLWRVGRHYAQTHWFGMPEGIEHFLVPSEFAKNILMKHLPENCRIDVLPNAVDVPHEKPVDVAANSDFYYIGRLSPEKGVGVFLEAADQLGITPVIIGDGPSRHALEAKYPNANYRGWLAPDQAHKELRKARALVFPSVWYETDGLVAKEAAGLGIPIIVSDQCAATETVMHGQTGLHFHSDNVSHLLETMERLSLDKKLVEILGSMAYTQFWKISTGTKEHNAKLEGFYRHDMTI